ncbi:MAG: DUF4268 domain-containing protein [Bacteroidota bacterium]|nr:DUF4268 domain-containing protein [Bacteroidota bacterium]
MYKKEEASRIKHAFWTVLGQYIAPHPSAEGIKVNWVNYKTGFKHVQFKMQADNKKATIGIELSHPDIEIQQMYFEQFLSQKNYLHSILNEEWDWGLHITNVEERIVSSIKKELMPINIYNEGDWPTLISFFKIRIIALDEFWSDAKFGFESLR